MSNVFFSIALLFALLGQAVPGASAMQLADESDPIVAAAAPPASQLMVVTNSGELVNAINAIQDGGIIELRGGTYPSPGGGSNGGFSIQDKGKGFTIRARAGEQVIIDGGGQRSLVIAINSNIGNQKPVTFEGITFTNGYSGVNAIAAGVTLHYAEMTFVNCTFTNNRATSDSSAGGAVQVSLTSRALFVNNTFADNSAKVSGGAIEVQDHAQVYVHNSTFRNNRTNLPGHSKYAAGGAIHVGNSTIRISNSRFENNQAGYVGGAFYAVGEWNNTLRTDVIISNSTFINNIASNDGSVPLDVPTEGGAFHVEANATARVYSSRFITNSAKLGGAMTNYRGVLEVNGSVFLGNRATGSGGPNGGFGGAIAATSNDVESTDYPSASLVVRNSYIQGRYGSVGTVSQSGGGIYISGDTHRNNISNRATLLIEQTAFVDLDVTEQSGNAASGGALFADLASVTMNNVLVTRSDASGSNSSAGALTFIRQSDANLTGITLVKNSAYMYGGAVFVAGSNISVNNSTFLKNSVGTPSLGSVFFSKPETYNVTGMIQNSLFSQNLSGPIFDQDYTNGPINSITYVNNRFYPGSAVYHYGVNNDQDVNSLNNFVATRSNGTSTDKGSQNTALGSAADAGALIAAPSYILSSGAVGDSGAQPAYVSYGWGGSSATLNGSNISAESGESSVTNPGNYSLKVGAQTYTAAVTQAATPLATASLNRTSYPYTLTWKLDSGTFLDAFADQHAKIPSASSGSVLVYPASSDTEYWVYIITQEGGVAVKTNQKPTLAAESPVMVLAGLNTNNNFSGIAIQNSGGGIVSWTASVQNKAVTLQQTSGQVQSVASVPFTVNAASLGLGTHNISATISAGDAGTKTVNLQILVVQTKYRLQLPLVYR